jgi:hydroxypyruvate reductase
VERGLEALRADALAIFRAGVDAADPGAAVRGAIRPGPKGGVLIDGEEVAAPALLRVVAVGKAATAMASASLEAIPRELFLEPGIAIANDENARTVDGFDVLATGHPVPDERGAAAARAVEGYISGARRGDGLLVLISGGGSALLPAPAPGITLEEKVAVTELLLRSGADIHEVNAVRKHISRLKGGGLAERALPAAVHALLLSDVIGDDLSTIASGLTAPDPTTYADARAVLLRRGVWDRLPAAVQARIERGARGEERETPKPGDPIFARVANVIVGSNGQSLDMAAEKARRLAYPAVIASRALTGEARTAAALLVRAADRGPVRAGARRAMLAGGETTVTIRGGGRGGRNQELALAFALEAEPSSLGGSWVFLSAGTDGRDGPTDAAGAIVDRYTLERGRRAGLDPRRALEENDSYPFLDAAGALLRTGGTGTNVADLQVFLEGTA